MFIICCALCAVRDGLMEYWSVRADHFHPMFLLLCGVVITEVASLIWLGIRSYRQRNWEPFRVPKRLWRASLYINLYTFISFVFYSLALTSTFGSGLTSVVAFGVDALFAALIGQYLFKEPIRTKFYIAFLLSLVGMICINGGITINAQGIDWYLGLGMAVFSSIFYCVYVTYMKILTQEGLSNELVSVVRLIFLTFGLATACVVKGWLPPLNFSLWKPIVSGSVYAASIILFVYCVRNLSMQAIGILFVLVPALTCIVNVFLGLKSFSPSEMVGITIVLTGAIIYEIS